MPAFGGSPLTTNGTFNPSQDGTTQQCRSLSLGGMCSPGALAGVTGVQTEVISGDWQQKVTGSATIAIDGNSDTTVKGNSGTTVHGDVTEQFNQNCKKTVSSNDTLKVHGNSTTVLNGSDHKTTLGPTLETKISEHTQVHQSPEHSQDIGEFTLHALFTFDIFPVFRFEADSTVANVMGAHLDIVGGRLTAGVWGNEFHLMKDEAKEFKGELHDLKAELEAAHTKIGGMDFELKAAKNELNLERNTVAGLYVIASPPIVGSILDSLIAEFALAAAF